MKGLPFPKTVKYPPGHNEDLIYLCKGEVVLDLQGTTLPFDYISHLRDGEDASSEITTRILTQLPLRAGSISITRPPLRGGFGEVYGGIFTRGGERHASELVALKVLKRYQGDGEEKEKKVRLFLVL